MNYAIRSSLYLLLLILDNIVSCDRVFIVNSNSQSDGGECRGPRDRQRGHIHQLGLLSPAGSVMRSTQLNDS